MHVVSKAVLQQSLPVLNRGLPTNTGCPVCIGYNVEHGLQLIMRV